MVLIHLKALHIIGFVSWFFGLYYLARLYLQYEKASEMPKVDREVLQQHFVSTMKRAYKVVANPAMMITWGFGIAMLVTNTGYFKMGWMHIKLLLLVLLTVYHLWGKRLIKKMEAGTFSMSLFQLKFFGEIPTIFLVGIVFLAVLGKGKGQLINYPYFFAGLLILVALVFFGLKASSKKSS
ncbi:MAG: TIGR00701 family protein [Bacteroidetes bacterium]|nr:TIGR00701 family protein [Bacteroidota bacterium]